jgi:hypothetical protein
MSPKVENSLLPRQLIPSFVFLSELTQVVSSYYNLSSGYRVVIVMGEEKCML